MKKPDVFGGAMMALVGAIWGLHGPALKLAYGAGLTFPQVALGEYLVATLVFGAVVLVARPGFPDGARFWGVMALAALSGGGVPLFLFWAYAAGPVPVGATLLFLYVPFTQLLNLVVTRRPPPPRELASGALVIAGAAVAADFFGAAGAESLRGAPQAVAAAFCFAVFFVCSARLGGQGTAALRSLVCCAAGAGLIALVSWTCGWGLVPAAAPGTATAWLLGLGLLGQVLPVFLMVRFGPRVGSGPGAILTSTELPVAVCVSALVLGDRIDGARLAGVALVLLGIALPHLRRGEAAGAEAGT